jgi:hypothetical protein
MSWKVVEHLDYGYEDGQFFFVLADFLTIKEVSFLFLEGCSSLVGEVKSRQIAVL